MTTAVSVLVPTETVTVSPHTTASFTPTELSEVFVVATVTGGSGLTASLTSGSIESTHTGLGPWSLEQVADPGTSGAVALYVFHARADAGVTAGTCTVTANGSTPPDLQVTVMQVTDARSYDTVRGVVSGQGPVGSFSLDLTEAPLVGDMVLGFASSRNDADGSTADPAFTELYDAFHSNPSASQMVQFRTGSDLTAVSVSGMDTNYSAFLAFIVKQEDGGAPAGDVWEAFVWDGTTLLPGDQFVTTDGTDLVSGESLGTA